MTENKNKGIPWREVWHTVISAILVGALTWAWNLQGRITALESQQNIVKRVENLENLLVPIIVEAQVNKALLELRGEELLGEARWARNESPAAAVMSRESPFFVHEETMDDGIEEEWGGMPDFIEARSEEILLPQEEILTKEEEIDRSSIEEQVKQKVYQYRPESK